MDPAVAESYRVCRRIARSQARNFYYSFVCLPPPKRDAMCAVYAWMRHADDISDDPGDDRTARLAAWRDSLSRAYRGDSGNSAILPAFLDTVRRYRIPETLFQDVIDGAEMDLSPRRYESFEETYDYCYHVASVVGMVCVHVFGFRGDDALRLAEWNGVAFQLTNILRDLREDAERDRVYLPQEDLRRFGYSEAELKAGVDNAAFRALMAFEVERAREYYRRAEPLIDRIDRDSRPCLRAMRAIYHGILDRIVAQQYDVFRRRARVPTWRKLLIASRAWIDARGLQGGSPSSA